MSTRMNPPAPNELPDLATFAMAAQLGSFTRAASRLGVSQAAVSQRISALENEVKSSLFDRRAGRIRLTQAGERLYEYARQIGDLHSEARAALGGLRSELCEELAIGASSVPGEYFLPALLSAFKGQYPGVFVRATVGDSASVLRDVARGEVALGLVGQEVDPTGLEAIAVGGDYLALVVAPNHRWAKSPAMPVESLRGEAIILREPGSGSRRLLEAGLERAGVGVARLEVACELGSNAAIKDAVGRGLGVAFLSYLCVRRELEAGELVRVEVRELDLRRSFYCVRDRHRPSSPAAGAFARFIETHPLPAACC